MVFLFHLHLNSLVVVGAGIGLIPVNVQFTILINVPHPYGSVIPGLAIIVSRLVIIPPVGVDVNAKRAVRIEFQVNVRVFLRVTLIMVRNLVAEVIIRITRVITRTVLEVVITINLAVKWSFTKA